MRIFNLFLGVGCAIIITIQTFRLVNYNRRIKELEKHNVYLNDSIRWLNMSQEYFMKQIQFAHRPTFFNFHGKNIYAFQKIDGDLQNGLINLDSLFLINKRNIILRYTEIGCDECSDITIKKLMEFKKLHQEVAIYILVDFTNYDSYLKWRKFLGITLPVYFLKKGELPFDQECYGYSYLFFVNTDLITYNFFIPNGAFPDLIDSSLNTL